MPHPVVTARWQNVVVLTWAVPPMVLERYVPGGGGWAGGSEESGAGSGGRGHLELDTKVISSAPGEPRAFVSLVATDCMNPRVFGIRVPWMGRVVTLSLRTYVRTGGGGRRGIVTIRTVSSSPIYAWVLRRWFNMPAVAAPAFVEVRQQARSLGAEYRVHWPEGGLLAGESVVGSKGRGRVFQEHLVRILAAKPVARPGAESLEQWLLQQPWSFGLDHQGRAMVHETIHPQWGVFPIAQTTIRLDFGSMFGVDFGFLADQPPMSSALAVGSDVAMFPMQATIGVRWGERGG